VGVWCYLSSSLPQCFLLFSMYYGVFLVLYAEYDSMLCKDFPGSYCISEYRRCLGFYAYLLLLCFMIGAMGLLSEA